MGVQVNKTGRHSFDYTRAPQSAETGVFRHEVAEKKAMIYAAYYMARFVIGIDEAGRGPLAGPVALGLVVAPEGFNIAEAFPGIKDSKLLTEKKREFFFAELEKCAQAGDLQFSVQFSAASVIDDLGMTGAIMVAIERGIAELAVDPASVEIVLDGALKAPPEFRQKTIIHGDATVPIISLASVAAKVLRDRVMRDLAKQYPDYGLDIHKGYATKAHYAAIAAHGPSTIHRHSFIHLT